MTRTWSEEDIAAFVDGSLDAAQAREIQEAIDTDPEAAALAAEIAKSNDILRSAFDDVLDERVPARLTAAVLGEPDKVVPLTRRRPAPLWIGAAMAASVAMAFGLGLSLTGGDPAPERLVALGDAQPGTTLHTALETAPAGTAHQRQITPMLTFVDRDGRYCREFEVTGELPGELEFGIACRTDTGAWHVEIAVVAPETEPGPEGFAPASGPAGTALDAMLDALGMTAPVTPDEEARLLQSGWPRAD